MSSNDNTPNDGKIRKVMISSTVRDLPDHRKAVEDAIHRMDMQPIMMEYKPAMDVDAVEASLKMVDDADLYVGVFAFRYGFVPAGSTKSVTVMEYQRAVKKKKPRLIFFMHEDHLVKPSDVETGAGAAKLKMFKDSVGAKRVAGFFKSVHELRFQVFQALVEYYKKPSIDAFHYVSDIPQPPEVYVAHPYTLLQTKDVVGREAELNLLADWVAVPSADVYAARILNIVALGGMGKSALTWKWFNDLAPHDMKPLAGRMWWSFYESDATFENFVVRALAYVTGRPREEIAKTISAREREYQLLAVLNTQPFLIVLDGLERILIAYSGMDAARQLDDDEFDKHTANHVAGVIGLPESGGASFVGQHRLRQCVDPRAGAFLRKLASTRRSRILVSTRLYPTELQAVTGVPIAGSFARFISGLSDDDALNLWRAYGVSGTRDELVRVFHTFGNYPLLIRALAGEVANDRRSPGNFDEWRAAHRDFEPFHLSMANARTHVLEFALRNLSATERETLRIVSAFRMPATYDTLTALLVGVRTEGSPARTFATEAALDTALASLEDRGLLGWDRRANRYDLHPIVRGVTWSGLGDGERTHVYEALHSYFESIPAMRVSDVTSLDDLTPAVELFNTVIGLGRYEVAIKVFGDRLQAALHYRLSASRRLEDLLDVFFLNGVDAESRLASSKDLSYVLNNLGVAYKLLGEPGRSITLYNRAIEIARRDNDDKDLQVYLTNAADARQMAGAMRDAVESASEALSLARKRSDAFRESVSVRYLGQILTWLGDTRKARIALEQALDGFLRASGRAPQDDHTHEESVVNAFLAQLALLLGDFPEAQARADRAWCLANYRSNERDFIWAARRQGAAALELGDYGTADERLHHSLTRARAVDLAEEELPSLTALAELRRRQGNLAEARELVDGVWDLAERGPYPLLHADARNVLAKVARDKGKLDEAVHAAQAAYRLSWCDGPPYAYHWGLEASKALLKELGASEPEMPPFDASQHPPMPGVEI